MSPERAREIALDFDLRNLPFDFYLDPYPVYDFLRTHEPIRLMPDGSLFLTRHSDLCAVYRDASTFSSDKLAEFTPKYGANSLLHEHHTTSLVFNDPPLHTRVRKTIMGALSRRAIAQIESDLEQLVARLLDRIEAQGGGDLIEDFAAAIPVEVIGNLLNIPHADRVPLRGWSLAILGALEPHLSDAQMALGNRSVAEFKSYLKGLTLARRKNLGDAEHDVLTRLIQSEPELSETELLQNCIFILNAGHETTTNLIGNALVLLHQHANAKREVLQICELFAHIPRSENHDLTLKMDTAVDEFLRFESSNQLGNRRAVKDFKLGDKHFETGTRITLCIAAANRDPAVFENPNTLQLHRSPNKHLAFGLGIHQCAGLSLARLEGRVAIANFLKRFPNYCLRAEPERARRARFRGFTKAQFRL